MTGDVLALLALPPDRLLASLSLLAALVIACEYLRQGLLVVYTQSRVVHLVVCLCTCAIQPVGLAACLIAGASRYPGQAWANLAYAAGLYAVWYLAGESVRLARADAQGADIGFLLVSALITFPAGLIAALVA